MGSDRGDAEKAEVDEEAEEAEPEVDEEPEEAEPEVNEEAEEAEVDKKQAEEGEEVGGTIKETRLLRVDGTTALPVNPNVLTMPRMPPARQFGRKGKESQVRSSKRGGGAVACSPGEGEATGAPTPLS